MTGEGGYGKGQEAWDAGIISEPGARGHIQSFEDLRVWQEAISLAEQVYLSTHHFPSSEQFGLTSQLRRAAVSVPSNIAEGWGRGSKNDYIRFLRIARGSLYEVKTQILIAARVGFLTDDSESALHARIEPLRRQLQGLITAVERSGA